MKERSFKYYLFLYSAEFILIFLLLSPGFISAQIDLFDFLQPKPGTTYKYAAVYTNEGKTLYDTSIFVWKSRPLYDSRIIDDSETIYDGNAAEVGVTRYQKNDFNDISFYYL